MAYRKRLRYWYVRLLVPYVFISEPSFVSPLVFGIDVFLSLGLFIGFSARGFNSENDAFRFQGQVLYDQMGWLFWGQGILFIATWSVGYATPSRSTFGLHVTLAGLRVASCALTAAWIYYFDLLGYFHQASLFLLGVLLIPAAIHLAGAYRRYRLARHKPSARHGAHGWNAAINHSTGFQIRNYSPTERVQRQEAALKTIKDSQIRPDEFFYYPPARLVGAQRRSKMSRFQSLLDFLWEYLNVLRRNDGDPDQVWLMDVVEQDSRSSPENNLFLPCYCCLDTDSHHRASYPAPESSQVLIERQIRDRFLNLPPAKFPGQAGGQNASRTRSNDTVYHKLCKHCTTMCHQSLLLRLQKEPNLQGLWDFMRYSLSSATIAEENFPHWSSAKELSRAARDGCHLCNLIWDTLSPEQMSALLERDEEESIYVKILSPLFYRRRVNGLHDYRADKSLRMVPHFGPGLVPRRWVKRRSAERAVSLGDGPTKQWDEGQVDPIKIHTTGFNNQGPIKVELGQSTRSDSTMRFIKAWLEERREIHEAVVPTEDDEPDNTVECVSSIVLPTHGETSAQGELSTMQRSNWPKRLLFVGDSNSAKARLVWEHQLENRLDRYAALSYCWGHPPGQTGSLQLKAENLRLLQRGVALTELSTTIRDAIYVTQQLGIRYLWVDALCIMQDSEVDKKAELPRMHKIYSNADIVISASASWDSSESFFADQNPLAMSPCLVGVRGAPGVEGRPFGAIYALPHRRYVEDAILDLRYSRVRSRGWVFQEEIMARRIVWFGDHQVHLGSNEGEGIHRMSHQIGLPYSLNVPSEPIPNMLHPDTLWFAYRLAAHAASLSQPIRQIWQVLAEWARRTRVYISNALIPPFNSQSSSLASQEFEILWWQWLFSYSTRQLSVDQDRLRAIEGAARHIHSQTWEPKYDFSATYMSGHWNLGHFEMSLLWYVRSGIEPRPKPYPDAPPSWSWASTNGTIANNSLVGNEAQSGVELSYTLDENNRVQLKLKGLLRAACWSEMHRSRRYYVGHKTQTAGPLWSKEDLDQFEPLSEDPTAGPEVRILMTVDGTTEVGYFVPDSTDDTPSGSLTEQQVFCFRIVVRPESEDHETDFRAPWATRGLALKKDETYPDDEIYKRVGYIELKRDHGGLSYPLWPESGLGMTRYPPPNIDITGFFQGDECREVEITIV